MVQYVQFRYLKWQWILRKVNEHVFPLKKSNLRIDRNRGCSLADLIARWPDGVVYVKYVFPSYYNYNTLYDMTLQLHYILRSISYYVSLVVLYCIGLCCVVLYCIVLLYFIVVFVGMIVFGCMILS